MSLTGNKGEWSELYVLLKLLATGKLYAADENTQPLGNFYFPIKKIFRTEGHGIHTHNIEYHLREEGQVDVIVNTMLVNRVSHEQLTSDSETVFRQIINGGDRSFCIVDSESIMNRLSCDKIKAPSSDKTDITLLLHDIHTGCEPICGFSIKSELGMPPTLLNASCATNFRYQVENLPEGDFLDINKIESKNKIIDRISKIYSLGGKLTFRYMVNETFERNLTMIDSRMTEILSRILLYYYKEGISSCADLANHLEDDNPMNMRTRGFYTYKLKKFLCAVALGLTPTSQWDGTEEANGGYIVISEDGSVLAYHIYNRDRFETYLLNHTKLEKASSVRHHYATIYPDDQIGYYIDLNLQIRFT